MAPKRGVHFAVFIEIWSDSPSTMVSVEEKNHAFADVNEDANLAAASKKCQHTTNDE